MSIETAREQVAVLRILAERQLANATEGWVFKHEETGAEIVIVEHRRGGELINVQLNTAEGHGPGWVSSLWADARGWIFVREAA